MDHPIHKLAEEHGLDFTLQLMQFANSVLELAARQCDCSLSPNNDFFGDDVLNNASKKIREMKVDVLYAFGLL